MLSTLASWILNLQNYFTTTSGKKIIANSWKTAGISDAIKKVLPLELLNSFFSIETLDQPTEDNIFYRQTTYPNEQAEYDSDDEDE